MAELVQRANGPRRQRHGADGVGRGLMDLDPPCCGGRPSGPRLPAAGRSLSNCRVKMHLPFERSAEACCFLQASCSSNIGVAHLTAPLASSEGRAAHDKDNVVLGGSPSWVAIQWLQTLAIGASVLHWLLFSSGRPDQAFGCNNVATSHLAAAMASSASHLTRDTSNCVFGVPRPPSHGFRRNHWALSVSVLFAPTQ